MNLDKALHELYEEKKRIDRAIARLESGLAELSDAPPRSRRGRKSMSEEERLQRVPSGFFLPGGTTIPGRYQAGFVTRLEMWNVPVGLGVEFLPTAIE